MFCHLKEKEVEVVEEFKLKDQNSKTIISTHRCSDQDFSCHTAKKEKCLLNDRR